MTDSGSDTLVATVVQSHGTTVAERQLQFTLALLTGYTTCHTTVHLVGQPVLTSHGFQLKHTFHVFIKLSGIVSHYIIFTFYRLVNHVSLRRRTEHLVNGQVERTHTVSLFEGKTMVTGCFTYGVHRSTFTFCNLANMFDSLFVDEQAHTFLTFVGDDFLGTQSFVTDRKLVHVNQTTTFFHQFRQAVHVTCRTVVVDRNNRVFVFFAEGTHHVVGTLLHFCIGTLNGIQFDAR